MLNKRLVGKSNSVDIIQNFKTHLNFLMFYFNLRFF